MNISTNDLAPVAPATEVNDRTTLGQNDFLRMLITQLESQDPLEPQDPTEFTAQLAQFTTLEQLIAIREGIDGLGEQVESTADLAALASLVGRDVVVRSDSLEVREPGSAPTIELELDGPADGIRVSLLGANGGVARTIDVEALGAGRHPIAWDGLAGNGTPLAAGLYTLRAESVSGKNASRITTLVHGPVNAVQPNGDGTAVLEVGQRRIAANEIVEVRNAR